MYILFKKRYTRDKLLQLLEMKFNANFTIPKLYFNYQFLFNNLEKGSVSLW